jgi:uncharacterized membrane protein YhaH (DUF805 family)
VEWYIKVLENYAEFEGRARRMEYWMFVLINLFILIGIRMLDMLLGLDGVIGFFYGLAILIPSIAVSVRRLHDTGRSGWWILIGIIPVLGTLVLLVFYCLDGDPGDNEYGPDPIRA